jgi:rhodanese-related sulfurtransferase
MVASFAVISPDFVRQALLDRREIALLDVREEDQHARAHPLFAANLPLGRIENLALAMLPRRDVPIVVMDDGQGEALRACQRLSALGYSDIGWLAGGLQGWRDSGGEVFIDVNVPSKAFGELVEAQRHTPSISAQELQQLLDQGEPPLVVDVRRFDEYQTMSIPGGVSVPGAELALRVPHMVADQHARVVVNCAGRTRSIIGTQSLINAGIPNPVVALRNGTIGWLLADQQLDHGQLRRAPAVPEEVRLRAAEAARELADRAGVGRATLAEVDAWRSQQGRPSYFFDVRSPEEYLLGHLSGFRPVAGGQLVQETEMVAPVRGARLVLVDDDGVRANMTASWLAQMSWEVYVLDGVPPGLLHEPGAWQPPYPPLPDVPLWSARQLATQLQQKAAVTVIDLGSSAAYRQGHVPGAWFALRSQLANALTALPQAPLYVLTCADGVLSRFAAQELAVLVNAEIRVLDGGKLAWQAAGLELDAAGAQWASEDIDRYRRPYEGTDSPKEAMQAYLDWEYGLVAQLERDGTHHFKVL